MSRVEELLFKLKLYAKEVNYLLSKGNDDLIKMCDEYRQLSNLYLFIADVMDELVVEYGFDRHDYLGILESIDTL